VIHTASDQIRDLFDIPEVPFFAANYNVAISQSAPVIRQEGDVREAALLRFGLLPAWAKDAKMASRCFNARSETVHEKPAFRDSFSSNRCLVLSNGFYEWEKSKTGKQPHFFSYRDQRLFAFAGLWSRNSQLGGISETFSIVTTVANDLLRPYHDRMPVILRPEDFNLWLDPVIQERGPLERLFEPFASDELGCHPVNPRVNSVKNQGEALMHPYQIPEPIQGSLF